MMIANRPHAQHHVYLRNSPAHDDSPGAFPLPPKPGSAEMMTVRPSSRAAVCRPAAAGARRGAGNRVETAGLLTTPSAAWCGTRGPSEDRRSSHTETQSSVITRPHLVHDHRDDLREHRRFEISRTRRIGTHCEQRTCAQSYLRLLLAVPTTLTSGGCPFGGQGPRARRSASARSHTPLTHNTRANAHKHTRACAHTHIPKSALARARMHAQARAYRRMMRTPTYTRRYHTHTSCAACTATGPPRTVT